MIIVFGCCDCFMQESGNIKIHKSKLIADPSMHVSLLTVLGMMFTYQDSADIPPDAAPHAQRLVAAYLYVL